MKKLTLLLACSSALLIFSCRKDPADTVINFKSSNDVSLRKGGGSGGGTATTGLISFVGGAFKLVGGNADSIQVDLVQPAPVGGWILALTSNDPSVQIPANFFVAEGSSIVHVPITSNVVTSARNVVIKAQLYGQSVNSMPFAVFPLRYNFSAPMLQSPGEGAGSRNPLQVKFTWMANGNAYYHDVQISNNREFVGTYLDVVYVDDAVWAQSYFNGLGDRYWRVRYVDASGAPGPWSEIRRFSIKP